MGQLAFDSLRDCLKSFSPEGAAMISEATNFRREAARAIRLAKEPVDALTRERLQGLAADYIRQAIELESGGQTAPLDIDPTEPI
jgi:hypothetical protein